MESLGFLLIFPILWPFIAKVIWKNEITRREIAINIAIGVVIVTIGWFGGRFAKTADTEILNGEIVEKHTEDVTCKHTYDCNCRQSCTTDRSGNRSCSQTCDTCHEHSFDREYHVETNVGNYEIDTVDRQGLVTPRAYANAYTGQPVARTHLFTNYVKASPDSLFNLVSEKQAYERFKGMIPAYPSRVYNYFSIDRILMSGTTVPNVAEWNGKLSEMLKRVGPAKQANVVIVFTSSTDPQYAAALRSAWLGAKKNDVVVVIGSPKYPEIAWARVISWTDNDTFKVQLADDIQDLKTATPDAVLGVVGHDILEGFARKHMRDFKYLQWGIEPPMWLLVLLFIASVAASVGTSIRLSRNSDRVGGFTYRRR
ncbi:hypothetical protein [Burkholderia cenocepacia]|uniref:hypothetical protein n=1 Tax=Burkholderia cenocepacia TaxID=95486 RepID=UPI00076C8158|nr:hypothetical protein [Burkholderia cenocepacia]KWU19112.1 hypothetical protein AS149_12760 [Burkholderia cenocepacia]